MLARNHFEDSEITTDLYCYTEYDEAIKEIINFIYFVRQNIRIKNKIIISLIRGLLNVKH